MQMVWWEWAALSRGFVQVDWVEKDCGSFQPWRLSRIGGEEKRQSKWTELVCLICVHVITGYGDEEQCCHSHQHLQVKILLYGREKRQINT